MNKSRSRPPQKASATQGAAAPGNNAVLGFTPDTSQPRISPGGPPAGPAILSPEVTHGCVDWFDYKNHPLQHPPR